MVASALLGNLEAQRSFEIKVTPRTFEDSILFFLHKVLRQGKGLDTKSRLLKPFFPSLLQGLLIENRVNFPGAVKHHPPNGLIRALKMMSAYFAVPVDDPASLVLVDAPIFLHSRRGRSTMGVDLLLLARRRKPE